MLRKHVTIDEDINLKATELSEELGLKAKAGRRNLSALFKFLIVDAWNKHCKKQLYMQTFLNKPELKTMMVEEIKWHKEQDKIIQGSYAEGAGESWKGCAADAASASASADAAYAARRKAFSRYADELIRLLKEADKYQKQL